MLLPNQNTLARVRQALANSGYGDNEDILSSHFRGFNKVGDEVHRITFRGEEEVEDSLVYVTDGPDGLKGDF